MSKKKATKKKSIAKHKPAPPVRVRFGPQKKEFEEALEAEAQAAELQRSEEDQAPSKLSPGADITNRPEVAAPAGLPDKAHAGLVPVLKIPFAIWSNIEKIPEIRLSDEEAEEWGLPVTQLLEYYFPGKIPEIAWVWLMFLSATGKVIDSRVKIRHDKKKASGSATSQGPDSTPSELAPGEAPEHEGAEPSEEFPQE